MILNIAINVLKILAMICIIYPISHGNIGFALLISTLCFLDYQVWIRGGNSYFFEDKTEIEKDLRKIQRLEIKKKLEELKK